MQYQFANAKILSILLRARQELNVSEGWKPRSNRASLLDEIHLNQAGLLIPVP
jgi:hypothetical protein